VKNPANPDFVKHVLLSHTFHEIQMYYPMRTVVSGRFKLIRNVAWRLEVPSASDLHGSKTWQDVLARKLEQYGPRPTRELQFRPEWEFYDLENDPNEAKNLIDTKDPIFIQRINELKSAMKQLQAETKDPWLSKWQYE
jgi:N-sulfoglucosamine sulfohydrolase